MQRFANSRDARSVLLLAAIIGTAPAVARSAETALQRVKDRDGNTPQPIVAVDNVLRLAQFDAAARRRRRGDDL